MNIFCFAGKVKELPVLKETASGVKMTSVALEVQRPFANSQGVYESDHIQVEVWRGLAETICNVAKIGTLISVKGRVAVYPYEKDGHTYYNPVFVTENLEFLG